MKIDKNAWRTRCVCNKWHIIQTAGDSVHSTRRPLLPLELLPPEMSIHATEKNPTFLFWCCSCNHCVLLIIAIIFCFVLFCLVLFCFVVSDLADFVQQVAVEFLPWCRQPEEEKAISSRRRTSCTHRQIWQHFDLF